MLGGIIMILGFLISSKLVTKAMHEVKARHPEFVKKYRFLLTVLFLAVFGYCALLCVLIGGVINGSPLDKAAVLTAHKVIVFLFLASLGTVSLKAAIAHLTAAKKASDGKPTLFKRGLLLLLLSAICLALLFLIF